ncbi:cysteine desulfurase [Reichenbachiella agarivorans]|uniref:Cysteine desulfurase n=1 Tax=Reichenbachiella agarivorans TaxID=2979464 RepID=A0ABY6CRT2_9BACT|nr:cysteine desulfurase family protein [Reichenbachiella agarivorans]UXP33230.1 cysteine desulfurase [Reichenbachiella agarivorans]
MKVYLDNSATTPVDPEVFEAMRPYFMDVFGNPSSIHSHGREARSVVERNRKKVAELLGTSPAEIFFTSGGTESDNTAIVSSVRKGVRVAITSPIEHHAVLHTLEALERRGEIALKYVQLTQGGAVDMAHLEQLLSTHKGALVSLMHANNELGNLSDVNAISMLCKSHGATYHSDTVQTMGKYVHNLTASHINMAVGSAHKFHGPKGVGFLYINGETKIDPFVYGGAQERNMRGGTENLAGIVGLAKGLEIAYRDMEINRAHITGLKLQMIQELKEKVKGVDFNGLSGDMDRSLYSVLNVGVPESAENDMLLFNLDIKGISVSGGSACASGTNVGSHVLDAIGSDPNRGAIRFSFSKYTTPEEISYAVDSLAEIINCRD